MKLKCPIVDRTERKRLAAKTAIPLTDAPKNRCASIAEELLVPKWESKIC